MIVHIGIAIALALALHIGASNAGVTMGPAVGTGARSRWVALVLAAIGYVLGALLLGPRVVATIGGDLFTAPVHPYALLVVAPTTTLSIIILANVLRVPIPTTHAAIASLVGLALYLDVARVERVRSVLVWWAATPIVALVVTYVAVRFLLRFELNGRFARWAGFLLTLGGAYVAFAVGANNAANASGALAAAGIVSPFAGAAIAGATMAAGALFFGNRMLSNQVADVAMVERLRLLVAGIVAATTTLAASWYGVPISLTLIFATSMFAFSLAGGGSTQVANVRRAIAMWTVSPIVAFGISYGLVAVLR